jgi:hypothetical protein
LIKWIGRPPSGLLVPAEVPEITIEAAVARSWEVPEGGQLLRVEKYASRELLDFFEANPRPTRETFLGSSRQRREALSRRRIG